MKRISGYVRSVPGGDPLLNIPVTVYDALTGIAIPTGGIYGADASPVNTDSSTGYFEWKTELDPGPIYIEAVTGVGQKKVRASVEQMPAYGIYISDIVEYFTVFSDGVADGRSNEFFATASGKNVTLQPGASIVAGRWLETLTNRSFTAADNTTLAERWDALILRQHIGGTALGRQEIKLIQGTVSGVLPDINTDPNYRDVLLWTVKLAQNAGTVTLVDNRSYTAYTIPPQTVTNNMITNQSAVSTSEIVKTLRASTSVGVAPSWGGISLGELSNVSAAVPTSTNVLAWNGTAWAPTAHDHSAEFAPLVHNHDSSYYTEAEVNTLLADKSNTGHTHDDRYYTEAEVDALLAGGGGGLDDIDVYSNDVLVTGIATALNFASNFQVTSQLAGARALIAPVFGTGSTNFAQGSHLHDDRYYTEAEISSLLAAKSATSHTHEQVPSLMNNANKTYGYTAVTSTTGASIIDCDITLLSGVTYDIHATGFGVLNAPSGSSITLGVKIGAGAIDWGTEVQVVGADKAAFASAFRSVTGASTQTVALYCKVGSGTGSITEGHVTVIAVPRNVPAS